MLNEENFELWLGALEGDEYEQTTCAFRRPQPDGRYTHCALGVLIEVAGKALGRDLWHEGHSLTTAYRWLGIGEHGPFVSFAAEELSEAAPAWIWILGDAREQLRVNPKAGVMFINDVAGESFPEIAQRLRKEYL